MPRRTENSRCRLKFLAAALRDASSTTACIWFPSPGRVTSAGVGFFWMATSSAAERTQPSMDAAGASMEGTEASIDAAGALTVR